ncbi:MAG TPA: DNA recombination protein RmuC [Candidatus Paceibacterota bacterium]
MDSYIGWVILIIIVAGFGFLFYFLKNQKKDDDKSGNQALLMSQMQSQLQSQMSEIRQTLDMKLGESTRHMQTQFGESTKIVRDVTDRLAKLDETNRQVVNFADQLRNLQDMLKNPKQRGVFGEYYLETLLKNAFQPKDYQMQYKFKDGEIVDAVLFMGDKIIPIDSKFSLENYNRIIEESDPTRKDELEAVFKQDLKKRIDETSKYIRPQEGTTEFAFMFIPAEGIYYDLLVNKVGAVKVNTRDLIDYAINEKKVHVVSPTTFYVTLQSMSQGMRAYQIQESTKEILKNVSQLERHLKAFADYHTKLGGHLQTSVNAYNSASKEFGKIDKDVLKLTGDSIEADVLTLTGPTREEG